MKKELFEIKTVDYLRGELNEKDAMAFENYLKKDADASKAFLEIKESWNMLDTISIPETSGALDNRFFEFLNNEVEKSAEKQRHWFNDLLKFLFRPQLVYGVILLAIGLILGNFIKTTPEAQPIQDIVSTTNETDELREKYVLTLLEQPSANKRLQGVNEVTKMDEATESITKALFVTLNNDSNVNVRLAAVESLSRYVDNPEVRMGLIGSITRQDSPIVQIALADLMVTLQERQSIKSMEELLDKPNIDTTVSKKLKESINQII